MTSVFKVTLLLLVAVFQMNALYFQLEEGENKCFFEETNQNQLILSSYEILDTLKEGLTLSLTVTDSNDYLLGYLKIEKNNGTIQLHNEKSSFIKLCFHMTSNNWMKSEQKVRFRMRNIYQFKSTAKEEFNDAVKVDDLQELDQINRDINKMATAFIDKQHEEMEVHADYFLTNELLNSRITMCTFIQLLVMLASALYQGVYLHGFMKQHRII